MAAVPKPPQPVQQRPRYLRETDLIVGRLFHRTDVPVVPACRPYKRYVVPLTPARIKAYLGKLAETGSRLAAAEAASPWCSGDGPGSDQFASLRQRDPQFAADEAAAMDAFLGKVEATIAERALNPLVNDVYHMGVQVMDAEGKPAQKKTVDNRLLVRVAERHNPKDWAPQRRVEHSGSVSHEHSVGVLVRVDKDVRAELLSMTREQRQAMRLLCGAQAEELLGDDVAPAETAEPEAIDAEFVDAEE